MPNPSTVWMGLLLLGVAILPYVRTWTYGLVYLDDFFFLSEGNWFFQDWSNARSVFTDHVWNFLGHETSLYRPLLLLPRFPLAALFDASPRAYHVFGTALHAGCVVLLFLVIRRLLRDSRIALATSALFALHPAHIATVAWIEGYNNTLAAFFVLSTIQFALLTRETKRPRWAVASAFAFLFALLTKESAIWVPLLAIGVLLLASRDERNEAKSVRDWLRTGPVPTLAGGWVTALGLWFLLRSNAIPTTPELEIEFIARSVERGWPGLLLYWGKVFAPFNLTPLPILPDASLGFGIASLVLYGCAIVLSKGTVRYALLLGMMWFFIVISPSLLVSRLETQSGAIFREDRLYQASLGVFLAIAFLFRAAARRFPRRFVAMIGTCAATWLLIGQARMPIYADGTTYWEEAAKGSPHLAVAHQTLAAMYRREGDARRERESLERALALNPRLEGLNSDMGAVLSREGSYTEADRYFEKELALYPASVKAHYNRGVMLYETGQLARAAEHLEAYLQLSKEPTISVFRQNAEALLDKIGRATESEREVRGALPRERRMHEAGSTT